MKNWDQDKIKTHRSDATICIPSGNNMVSTIAMCIWSRSFKSLANPMGSLIGEMWDFSQIDIGSKRDNLVRNALASGTKNILFISDDVAIPPNTLIRMLERRRQGARVITGVYWTKANPSYPYIFKNFLSSPFWGWEQPDGTIKPWHVGDFFQIDWSGCFQSGELVMTPSGLEPIEKLQPGNTVLSGLGIPRKITRTYNRNYKGQGFKILSYGNSMGQPVTPQHPFLVAGKSKTKKGTWRPWHRRCKQERWVNAQDIEIGDVLVSAIPQFIENKTSIDLADYMAIDNLIDHKAIDEKIGAWSKNDSGFGRAVLIRELVSQFKIPKTTAVGWVDNGSRPYGFVLGKDSIKLHSRKPTKAVKRYIPLNEKLMRFTGLFLGDGGIELDRGWVSFTFSPHEKNLAEEIKLIGESLFGITPSIRQPIKNANYILIQFRNKLFAHLWSNMLDQKFKTKTKQIPEWCLFLKPNLQRILISGLIDSDGWLQGGREKIQLSNLALIEGIKYLYARNGIAAAIQKIEAKKYSIQGRTGLSSESYVLNASISGRLHRGHKIIGNKLYHTVKDIKKTEIDSVVHNIEVEVDHSYLSISGTSKNCDCLMIDADVFRELKPPWFSLDYSFLPNGEQAHSGTEDLYFFSKLKEAGIPLYCDSGIQCDHIDRTSGLVYRMPHDCPNAHLGSEIIRHNPVLVADLGAGRRQNPLVYEGADIVRFDSNPECNPDVICDVRRIPDLDEKYDIVNASHLLEHLPSNDPIKAVQEWKRILKTGGKLIIEVPNIAVPMRHIVDGSYTPYDHQMIWGTQEDEGNYHLNGFTVDSLRNIIILAGGLEITSLTLEPHPFPEAEIRIEAVKTAHRQTENVEKIWTVAQKGDCACE